MTNSDKVRQLSEQQSNSIEYLLQGQSDRAVSEAVGVARQTVWAWRNTDPLFVATLNKRRQEVWVEAKERLKNLTGKALDVLENDLSCRDPKIELAAAQFILKRMDQAKTPIGPTTPEDVIYGWEKAKVAAEVEKSHLGEPSFLQFPEEISSEIERKALERTKKALKEYGL